MSRTVAPRVSVVIPVYNSMPYLTGTMTSLLTQEMTDFEVIAVNDGSTDGSAEELDRFAQLDSRITVVHQPNSGWPGSPRNRGLNLARGEFVFFMDADDTMAPEALRLMVAQVDDAPADAPIDVVIPRFAGTGGRKVQSLFLRHPQGAISIGRAMETLSPQKLFRREMIEADGLRFPEEKVRLEDGIFVTRSYVIARGITFCGHAPLYFIAQRDDGQNISWQRIDPDNYVASCGRIADILMTGVADTGAARRLVFEFFLRKGLRFYVAKRWNRLTGEERTRWVQLHREFLRDRVSPDLDATAPYPTDRQKLGLIRAGDLAGLNELIGAATQLAHTSVCVGSRDTGLTLTLDIEVQPADTNSLIFAPRRTRGWRFSTVRVLHRVLRPFLQEQLVRRVLRSTGQFLTPSVPSIRLMLQGRRHNTVHTVHGTALRCSEETSNMTYRFVISPDYLRGLGTDRVDMWTVAQSEQGLSGSRVRVRAKSHGTASQRGRVYTTDAGNTSIRLTRANVVV